VRKVDGGRAVARVAGGATERCSSVAPFRATYRMGVVVEGGECQRKVRSHWLKWVLKDVSIPTKEIITKSMRRVSAKTLGGSHVPEVGRWNRCRPVDGLISPTLSSAIAVTLIALHPDVPLTAPSDGSGRHPAYGVFLSQAKRFWRILQPSGICCVVFA